MQSARPSSSHFFGVACSALTLSAPVCERLIADRTSRPRIVTVSGFAAGSCVISQAGAPLWQDGHKVARLPTHSADGEKPVFNFEQTLAAASGSALVTTSATPRLTPEGAARSPAVAPSERHGGGVMRRRSSPRQRRRHGRSSLRRHQVQKRRG